MNGLASLINYEFNIHNDNKKKIFWNHHTQIDSSNWKVTLNNNIDIFMSLGFN